MHYIFRGSKSKDLRDRVMVVLAQYEPLKAREIYTLLRQRYKISESYQAIHKALGIMVTARILEKTGLDYTLRKRWVKDMGRLLVYISKQSYSESS